MLGPLIGGAVGDLVLANPGHRTAALIDIKAMITSRVSRRHLLQLLGYALLDDQNVHSIDQIGRV